MRITATTAPRKSAHGDHTSCEASVLHLVDAQYRNAATCSRHRVVLDFPPVAGISAACAHIFSGIDREDERQRRIARSAWLLKTTVLQTLLPFDDPRLGLESLIATLRQAVDAVPTIASSAAALADLVGGILAAPRNPKREWFCTNFGTTVSRDVSVAVLVGLQGGATPGWPVGLTSDGDFGLDSLTLVRTRKDIRERVFSSVVIPGTLRFAVRPLVHDMLYGGRAAEVIVLSYRAERIYVPEALELPADTTFKGRRARVLQSSERGDEGPDVLLDRWVNESFWQEIRAQHADFAPLSERDVAVPARFVLFADGSGAFLPEDRTVVEISDLIDSGGDLEIAEDRLPRKPVRDLEERDVVMLRLSGSGHYLDDVADAMMAKAGLSSLRSDATEWKSWLHTTIKRHGEGLVSRTGQELGLRLRSPGYLWVWAGDAVIAPHDYQTFRQLIGTLVRIDASASSLDPDVYATEKWQQMEHVKAYHHRAGIAIRTALLERVKGLVAERHRVESVESIELPGLEAGSMGLLRVAAVDNKSMQVPLSRLFHITAVKVG